MRLLFFSIGYFVLPIFTVFVGYALINYIVFIVPITNTLEKCHRLNDLSCHEVSNTQKTMLMEKYSTYCIDYSIPLSLCSEDSKEYVFEYLEFPTTRVK